MKSDSQDSGSLAVVGAINWDTTIYEERFAGPGEEVPVVKIESYPGGKGANVAVAASKILGRGRVALVGALGNDELGKRQIRILRSEGVGTSGISLLNESSSGQAIVLVDGAGRKTIHTHFGANDYLNVGHLSEGVGSEVLRRSSWIVLMDAPTRVAEWVARTTRARSPLIYSPGVRSGESPRALRRTILSSDFLVLDRSELANISRKSDPKAGLKSLNDEYPEVTIVATMGPEGSLVAHGNKVKRIPPVSLNNIGLKAVNSTGSGDAFLGTLACYLMSGASIDESVRWATLAGALKATRFETRGSPTAAVLIDAMNRLESKQ